jgi:hypothetical protein
MHPLLRPIAIQPQLLAEPAAGYAELACAEIDIASDL